MTSMPLDSCFPALVLALEPFGGDLHQVGDAEEAGALLEEIAMPGDRVLVKGSRSVGLEKVLA